MAKKSVAEKAENRLLSSIEKSGEFGEWFSVFREELNLPWFSDLIKEVVEKYKGKDVAPHQANIFRAFRLCPPKKLRVLLLGQDPYPYPFVADGLAFSTLQLQRPKSLINIVLEARKYFKGRYDYSKVHYWNDLSQWSKVHGVMLLNSALTVQHGVTNSHSSIWKPFMEKILPYLKCEVAVLMGREAEKYGSFIKAGKILTCPHPAARDDGFKDCDIFNEINKYTTRQVNWGLFKEDCLHAGLYADDILLGKIPGCFYMHKEVSTEINKLVGKKTEELAFLEPKARLWLKQKLTPEYMSGNDVHLFYNEVLTTAMNLPDETIISSFKLIK